MKLSAVVAYSQNRVMGKNNQLPWHLPDDLKHFKALTVGKPVLMGRKTYESIGKPLPNRRNIILSRDPALQIAGCEVIHSIDELKATDEEIMVIGGAEIFAMLLPQIDTLYLTEIQASIDGDVFFPTLPSQEWQEISRQHHPSDATHQFPFDFIHLKKK
ncbi:MAG: dihydrofolate reductase [Gammaproteobacteria bacterium]|nr:dihydrofolate reductase [Gammaproteobacteria bacterium]